VTPSGQGQAGTLELADPCSGPVDPPAAEIAALAAAAGEAAAGYGAWPAARRRDLLHACAAELAADADALVAVARRETGLTEARLRGELDRTTGQLRLLGDHVAAGRHLDRRTSAGAAPDGADIVAVAVPVGPVAVFAASNFPFAFGVPGGDTASALAAGCPVVVKAHPAQPGTSRALAATLARAVAGAGAPGGVFALVEGGRPETSIALVQSPQIRAVGFTGSLRGGRALLDAATARPDPIPVYAEMGSLNPVFVLPDAARDEAWAVTLAASVTGSAGQLCTKPGLIVVPDDDAGSALATAIAAGVAAAAPHPMLTPGMADAHAAWAHTAATLPGTRLTPPDAGDPVGEPDAGDPAPGAPGRPAGEAPGGSEAAGGGEAPRPFAVEVAPDALTGALLEEHFGPTTVVVRCPVDRYGELAGRLDGSLTATVIGTEADTAAARALLPALTGRAGRIVWNGVPTGVAVCEAMHHGGPWPATSAPWSTSVGTGSIQRFLRPVAVQGLPAALLDAVAPDATG
jgi:NADP-dependent aldehyde dehydrogenase